MAIRAELNDFLQEHASDLLASSDEEIEVPDTGVLTGWMLVAEWAADDGERWLTYHRRNEQTSWLTRGLLAEAMEDLPK